MRLSEGTYSNLNVNDNIYIKGKPLLDKGTINSVFLTNDNVIELIHSECKKMCEHHQTIHTEMNNTMLVKQDELLNMHASDVKQLTQTIQDMKKEISHLKSEITEMKKMSAFK